MNIWCKYVVVYYRYLVIIATTKSIQIFMFRDVIKLCKKEPNVKYEKTMGCVYQENCQSW